jgi:hypothetical protein
MGGYLPMQNAPIVEEIRRIREDYAKQFNFDIRAMAEDLRKSEQEHPERLVNFPAKPLRRSTS